MGNVANGAKVYFTIHTPWIDISITQTAITVLVATLVLSLLAFLVSRNIKKRPGKAQTLVEKLVTMLYGLVTEAEERFGGGTGSLKQAYVFRKIYSLLPAVVKVFISAERIAAWIEEALSAAKEKWAESAEG